MLLELLTPVPSGASLISVDPLMTLAKAIEGLEPEQRVILSLIHFEELDAAQIALVLGVPEHSIEVVHQKALETLRASLAPSKDHSIEIP